MFLLLDAEVTQVGNFGYDVARAGDELHVVVHEDHERRVIVLDLVDIPPGARPQFLGGRGESPTFEPATPPALLEGLTGPLPAPQADHRHQLRLLRLR